ncbi:MAG TPA: serine hydrolase domain-containing protein [Symbiobacteriaceae bacterium]|nr:serine hydrolase domain-containing protein [Symbiobacteriaceae bacterium]
MPEAVVGGSVASGFEAVANVFEQNFATRGEVGAAFAAYVDGVKVADLWGGLRDKKQNLPWEEKTLAIVFSTTKGMSAIALAVAHSRGLFELDQPVARYWPEFAQAGKERITVRQLLAHEAGLVALDLPTPPAVVGNRAALSDLLAGQKPLWEPGTRHAYHAITLGWYQSELLRRVDPEHRSLGRFFQDEIASRLGVDFYIGLPESVPDSRLAALAWPTMRQMLFGGGLTFRGLLSFANRKSLFWRSLAPLNTGGLDFAAREFLALEVPSGTGIGEARALARVYGAVAAGGAELGLRPETLAELTAPVRGSMDEVLGMEMAYHFGLSRPWATFRFGSDASSFGCPGLGGSFGFADPKARVGFGYVCNRLGPHMKADPRAQALWDALYRCLGERRAPVSQVG